jgi:hypothetical protein
VLRRTIFLGAASVLVSATVSCSGNTKPINGCQSNEQCPSGQICRPLDGQCVSPPDYATITVVLTGSGGGSVTSTPAGIDCGNTCSAQFEVGSKVVLTAMPASGSRLASFSIGCNSGTTTCEVTPQTTEPLRVLVNFSAGSGTPPAALCNEYGFCWENPKPVGNRLSDAVVVAPGELWAVGDAGTIVRRAGGSFSLVASGTTRNLYGLAGTASDLYAVGEAGTILHGVSGVFSAEPSGVSTDLNDVWTSGSAAFAVGNGGVILRRGASWTTDASNTAVDLRGVWGQSTSDIWAVGNSGTVVRYNGASWSAMMPGVFSGGILRQVVGSGGTVYIDDSAGGIFAYNGSFSLTRRVVTDDLYGMAVVSGTPFIAGNNNGGMVLRYNGTAWVSDGTGVDGFRAVSGSGTNDLWAVGEAGTIWQSDGSPWQPRSIGTAVALNSVYAQDGQNVWAVGSGGAIMRYNGSFFNLESPATSAILYGISGTSSSDVWAVGAGGVILHYDGANWLAKQSGTTQTLRAVHALSASRVYAVGDGGTVVAWDGTSWTTMATGTTASLRGVWAASSSEIWAVGELGRVLRSSGGAFSQITPSPATSATIGGVWGSAPGDLWITADTTLYHYQAGTFTQVNPPSPVSGLRGIFGNNASDIYATGTAGVLLRYNGVSWSRVPTGAATDLTAVASSAGKLWVVGSSGTILRK